MASRGMFFGEGPTACPFVALENDRDRRSDEPDHRHRCYAEPEPAPRALAHQREYCLAAAFTTCPIFQDWAIRAAATPVPLRPGRMPDVERDPQPAWAAPPPWLADEQQQTGEVGSAADQGAAFVAPPVREEEPAELTPDPPADIERVPSLPLERGRPLRSTGPPPPPLAARQPEPEPEPEPEDPTDAPPPPFLAGRAERSVPAEKLRREDVVPSWGRAPLYSQGKSPKVDYGDGGGWTSRITTLLAIGVILALALTAIILAPALLDGSGADPGRTPPVAAGSPTPARATPTPRPTATPVPTPVTYTIQSGDTLFSIALTHGLTVEQLLAANPEITNPDLVQIGQQIIIPGPDFVLASPGATADDQ